MRQHARLALEGAGQSAEAQDTLARLLALAAPDNHVRVFLDAGEPMRQALQYLQDRLDHQENTLTTTTSAFVSQLLAAFEQAAQHSTTSPASQHTNSGTVTEPLTLREQEVLRLLVSGSSNAEIAATLVISLGTVKKHVSNILAKLQVESRAQAIAQPRDLPNLI